MLFTDEELSTIRTALEFTAGALYSDLALHLQATADTPHAVPRFRGDCRSLLSSHPAIYEAAAR